MSEYIKREAVKKVIDNVYTDLYPDYVPNSIAAFRECLLVDIGIIPAADVYPQKHGRWIITDDVEHFIAICSECGRTEDSRDIKDMPYCHCGARMDGDNNA